jgi:hypothetical protein
MVKFKEDGIDGRVASMGEIYTKFWWKNLKGRGFWETYEQKGKGVPLHAMVAPRGRGGIAPTHSQPRH